MGGTAGEPDGARVVTSGWPGTLRPSVELTQPQWTGPPALEDLAMMSSTCAASVVSSLTSLGLLAPTTLPCLEHLLNKTLAFSTFSFGFLFIFFQRLFG